MAATGIDSAKRRTEWIAERIGWGVMLLFVVAALVGLLARGPLSARDTCSANGNLCVHFEAVAHADAPEEFVIDVKADQTSEPLRLAVSRSFLDNVSRIEWTPPPEASSSTGDDVVYEFATHASAQRLVLRFRHNSWGRKHLDVRLLDGAAVTVLQYVLP